VKEDKIAIRRDRAWILMARLRQSLIIQLGAKECLIPADDSGKDYENIKIRGVLDRCGIVITDCKKGDFATKNIEQDLNRLLEGEISSAALRKLFEPTIKVMAHKDRLISSLHYS
jgi:hypothetical protein